MTEPPRGDSQDQEGEGEEVEEADEAAEGKRERHLGEEWLADVGACGVRDEVAPVSG